MALGLRIFGENERLLCILVYHEVHDICSYPNTKTVYMAIEDCTMLINKIETAQDRGSGAPP